MSARQDAATDIHIADDSLSQSSRGTTSNGGRSPKRQRTTARAQRWAPSSVGNDGGDEEDDNATDMDVDLFSRTPRPTDRGVLFPVTHPLPPPAFASSRRGRKSPDPSRSPSRRSNASSSPSKQLMELSLHSKEPFFRRQLEGGHPPDAVVIMCKRMDKINYATGILPSDGEDGVLGDWARSTLEDWKAAMLFRRKPCPQDTYPGRLPSPDEIARVVSLAMDCNNGRYDEATWNTEVHHRLLDIVFRPPIVTGEREEHPLTVPMVSGGEDHPTISARLAVIACTTVCPHPSYLPGTSFSKKIDFCFFVDDPRAAKACHGVGSGGASSLASPESVDERDVIAAYKDLRNRNPAGTVNHTDYYGLLHRPLAISIETKKLGESLEKAELQLGVWHKAHWNFLLANIVDPNLIPQALSELGYLPAIIIQGHQWSFAASTLERTTAGTEQGYATVLWTSCLFGSTETECKTYQIISGLRELAAWARDIYWPWFQKWILGLGRTTKPLVKYI